MLLGNFVRNIFGDLAIELLRIPFLIEVLRLLVFVTGLNALDPTQSIKDNSMMPLGRPSCTSFASHFSIAIS
jgi:hypothetical protein